MTIDKAIHRAPLGLPQDDLEGDIEIEIEDPEGVRISMDGLEIELGKADPDTVRSIASGKQDYI